MEKDGAEIEAAKPKAIPYMRMVFDQGVLTDDIINHHYNGAGTDEDPFVVTWIDHDPRNPLLFSGWLKWSLTMLVAFATLAVAFVSSAYSGGVEEIILQFHASQEVVTLGISLFVLGFAIGPLLWAPLSELYGRQYLFFGTYAMLTVFNAGAAGSQNIQTLLILRFFAGAFGSSPLTNAGGVIADMFPARQRGLALGLFATAPFMGPVLGPIVGGFVGETVGWRWVEGVMAIFSGALWLICSVVVPETYPPVLLRKRAAALAKRNGKVYESQTDIIQGKTTASHAFKTALSRPWILLFLEPIVLLLSLYMAIIYGTLYMMFGAFPIVYQEKRGWTQGIGGLAFLGVAVGMLFAVLYSIWENRRYLRVCERSPDGFAPPEARLPQAIVGGIAIPVGLFWFAWTNSPSVHWMASIAAGVPFGFGMVLVFLSIMNYLVDAYVIFAASVLAANAVLRSTFGAAFPLFTTYMYQSLGIHWASSVPGFLALACVPFPFLFYKYGSAIRARCKFAAEADRFVKRMRGDTFDSDEASDKEEDSSDDKFVGKGVGQGTSSPGQHNHQPSQAEIEQEEEREQEAFDYSYDDDAARKRESSGFEEIRPGDRLHLHRHKTAASSRSSLGRTSSRKSRRSIGAESVDYEANPYDIDRVNTREYFESRPGSPTRSLGLKKTQSRK